LCHARKRQATVRLAKDNHQSERAVASRHGTPRGPGTFPAYSRQIPKKGKKGKRVMRPGGPARRRAEPPGDAGGGTAARMCSSVTLVPARDEFRTVRCGARYYRVMMGDQ